MSSNPQGLTLSRRVSKLPPKPHDHALSQPPAGLTAPPGPVLTPQALPPPLPPLWPPPSCPRSRERRLQDAVSDWASPGRRSTAASDWLLRVAGGGSAAGPARVARGGGWRRRFLHGDGAERDPAAGGPDAGTPPSGARSLPWGRSSSRGNPLTPLPSPGPLASGPSPSSRPLLSPRPLPFAFLLRFVLRCPSDPACIPPPSPQPCPPAI